MSCITDMRTGAPTIPEDNGIPMTLLERYCAETATTGERAEVEAWFAAHPDTIGWSKTPEVDIVRRAYEIMGVFRPVDLTTGVDTQVTSARQPFSEMTGVGVPVLRRVRFKAQPLRRWIWYGGATVAIGVLGVLIGWHNGARQRFEPTVRPMSTYATTNGQRATITLLDGTTVVLGVASRLDVPGDFAAGNHQVALAGEALFTVLHHMGTPFTVLAGTSQTRVLGTSFVVRHYPHDTVTTVAVRDGKVIVDSAVVVARHLVLVGPHHQL
ncbi:MAG TPA: FecR domain-containing protein, partial [Gemmatimonadaceae bacterium]|nr:FecR domain-containing protein [Gemmatimonadaceae bacterium]